MAVVIAGGLIVVLAMWGGEPDGVAGDTFVNGVSHCNTLRNCRADAERVPVSGTAFA